MCMPSFKVVGVTNSFLETAIDIFLVYYDIIVVCCAAMLRG